jgi:hypothetical protein
LLLPPATGLVSTSVIWKSREINFSH